jgi:hypothetical protein
LLPDLRFFPRSGLSGGGLRFDPTSLLLFSAYPRDNYRLLSQTSTDTNFFDKQPFDDRARVLHEYDHLLRSLSTSWGILRHALSSLLTKDALLYIEAVQGQSQHLFPLEHNRHPRQKQIRAIGGRILPLLESISTGSPDGILLRYLCRKALLKAFDGEALRGNLHLVDCGLMLFRDGLSLDHGTHPRSVDYAEIWDAKDLPEIHPTVQGITPLTFSAKPLLEAFAIERELMYANRFGKPEHESSDLTGVTIYRQCIELFDRRFRDRGSMHIPLEFDAITELSLWIPMTLRGVVMDRNYFIWTDFEPGYRFCKLMDWLVTESPKEWVYPEGLTEEESNIYISEFQEKAAKALGWPTPSRLIDLLIEELTAIDTSKKTLGSYAVIHDESPRLQWVLALLKERRKSPFAIYDRFMPLTGSQTDLPSIWFPGGIFPDGDSAFSDLLFDKETTHFDEWHVLVGSRSLLEGFGDSRMPRHHAHSACELIRGYGNALLNNSDFGNSVIEAWRAIEKLPSDVYPCIRH